MTPTQGLVINTIESSKLQNSLQTQMSFKDICTSSSIPGFTPSANAANAHFKSKENLRFLFAFGEDEKVKRKHWQF